MNDDLVVYVCEKCRALAHCDVNWECHACGHDANVAINIDAMQRKLNRVEALAERWAGAHRLFTEQIAAYELSAALEADHE